MSIFGNLSDLAHEIRSGVGTVLTILGSKLEADARARVECGPQWLTEFEEQRDSLEPDGQLFECSAPTCGCHDDPRYQAFPAPEDSAAATADPSPTVPNAHSVVGDCPGSDSVIVAGESPREVSTDQPSLGELEAAWREFTDGVATFGIEVEDVYAASQMRLLADRIDPPTAVSHEDLAAHLTGAAIRANTGHPDVLIDAFASSLLADFNITKK